MLWSDETGVFILVVVVVVFRSFFPGSPKVVSCSLSCSCWSVLLAKWGLKSTGRAAATCAAVMAANKLMYVRLLAFPPPTHIVAPPFWLTNKPSEQAVSLGCYVFIVLLARVCVVCLTSDEITLFFFPVVFSPTLVRATSFVEQNRTPINKTCYPSSPLLSFFSYSVKLLASARFFYWKKKTTHNRNRKACGRRKGRKEQMMKEKKENSHTRV